MEAAAGRPTDFDSNSAPYQHLTANLTWTERSILGRSYWSITMLFKRCR
jgi:hypothetical protein